MTEIEKRKKAELVLLLVALIWGGTFAFIKRGLTDASPLVLLSLRFGLSFIIFTALYYKKIQFNGKKTLLRALVLGILMFFGYVFQTVGLNYTSAGRAGFITYTYSLLIPFLQFWILGKKPVIGNILGLLVVFAGLWILSNPLGGAFRVGDLITFGASIAYALYIVFLDRYNREESPALMTSLQMLVTAILSIVAAFIFETPRLDITWGLISSLAYLVLLGTVFCTYMMNVFQKDTTPMRATLIYAMEPVFSVVFAIFLLREPFSVAEIWGSGLILAGVLLSQSWEFLRSRL